MPAHTTDSIGARDIDRETTAPRLPSRIKKETPEVPRTSGATFGRSDTQRGDQMLNTVASVDFHDVPHQVPNLFLPSARFMFETIFIMDALILANPKFTNDHVFWFPMVSRLYFSVLFWVQTLRAMNSAGFLHLAGKQFLDTFLSTFPIEDLMIPGPLVYLFMALSSSKTNFSEFGDVLPWFPIESFVVYQNRWYCLDESNTQQWQYFMPNVRLMLDQCSDFIKYCTDHAQDIDFNPSNWHAGLNMFRRPYTNDESYAGYQAYSAGMYYVHYYTPTLGRRLARHASRFPLPARWPVPVVNPIPAYDRSVLAYNAYQTAFGLWDETEIPTNEDGTPGTPRFKKSFKPPKGAKPASSPPPATPKPGARPTYDQYGTPKDFVAFMGMDDPDITWFRRIAVIMNDYCKFFDGSVPLSGCSPSGTGAAQVKVELVNRRYIRGSPRLADVDDNTLQAFNANLTLPEFAERHAMSTLVNVSTTFHGVQRHTENRSGPYWTVSPVLRESSRFNPTDSLRTIINDYFRN